MWKRLLYLIFAFAPAISIARGPGWNLSMPTFSDDGDHIVPIAVLAGSMSAVTPYTPDLLKDRGYLIQNPSSNYQLYIGTWSGFTVDNPAFIVTRSTAGIAFSSHQTVWLRYPPGAASETVKGAVFKE